MINEFCANCFLLAQKHELADLKGLIDPESGSDQDYELLSQLDDPVVKKVMSSVDKTARCLGTFFIINNLDETLISENEEYRMLASDSYICYAVGAGPRSYAELVEHLQLVYLSIAHMLYHTTRQLELNDIYIPEIEYHQIEAGYAEILNESIRSEDKNVILLYELMVDLNQDLCEINKHS